MHQNMRQINHSHQIKFDNHCRVSTEKWAPKRSIKSGIEIWRESILVEILPQKILQETNRFSESEQGTLCMHVKGSKDSRKDSPPVDLRESDKILAA